MTTYKKTAILWVNALLFLLMTSCDEEPQALYLENQQYFCDWNLSGDEDNIEFIVNDFLSFHSDKSNEAVFAEFNIWLSERECIESAVIVNGLDTSSDPPLKSFEIDFNFGASSLKRTYYIAVLGENRLIFSKFK